MQDFMAHPPPARMLTRPSQLTLTDIKFGEVGSRRVILKHLKMYETLSLN